MDARLDAMTLQKVDDLAARFRQPRAAVLGHIMRWGLSRGQTGSLDCHDSHGPVRHLSCLIVVCPRTVSADLDGSIDKM
jgi:hypothetical protein